MQSMIRSAKQLGNLIRSTRKKLCLTQGQLGNKAGLRQETISLIENGNPATRLDTLLHVIAILDLDIGLHQRRKSSDVDFEDLLT